MSLQPASRSHPNTSAHRQQREEQPAIDVSDIRFGASVDADLYAGIAEQKAQFIAKKSSGEVNKSAQLRRFYDELILWNGKVNGSGNKEERARKYAELAPLVKMLIAKVAYAKGRRHVDEQFERLFRRVIEEVKDATTLEQAKLFMEAFMGFYKAYNPK